MKNSSKIEISEIAITGASGALGLALCNSFMSHGWGVTAISRSKPHPLHAGARFLRADLAEAAEVERLITSLQDIHQLKYVVFCHAEPEHYSNSANCQEEWQKNLHLLATNLLSNLTLTRKLGHLLTSTCFVNLLGGGIGGTPTEQGGLYTATKSALATLVETESKSSDFLSRGNSIIGLSPGRIKGGIARRLLLNLDSNDAIPRQVEEDAKVVESTGANPMDISEAMYGFLTSLYFQRMKFNGRILSLRYDTDLLNGSPTQLSDDDFRLRRRMSENI